MEREQDRFRLAGSCLTDMATFVELHQYPLGIERRSINIDAITQIDEVGRGAAGGHSSRAHGIVHLGNGSSVEVVETYDQIVRAVIGSTGMEVMIPVAAASNPATDSDA